MLKYILLIAGFILLIKGADFFVEGSSAIARIFKIPSIIIGLTIVAFGTSMPEASVSVTAALSGSNELALSNVIGSNIFNLLVVVGTCAAIKPLSVQQSVVKKEFPFSILITLLLLIFSLDSLFRGGGADIISRIDGFILFIFFLVFVFYTVRTALASRHTTYTVTAQEEKPSASLLVSTVYIIGGILGIVIGGELVVNSASGIALTFGLSETLIGLTVVALGTSLPELVTSVVAARKGESDIALGNVIGSNIFNILLVLGASSFIHPVLVNRLSVYDTVILLAVSILTYFFAAGKRTINRLEGVSLLLIYALYTCYIIMRPM